MKQTLDLNQYDLVGMNGIEMQEVDGGFISIITTIPGAARFILGAVTDIGQGLYDGFKSAF